MTDPRGYAWVIKPKPISIDPDSHLRHFRGEVWGCDEDDEIRIGSFATTYFLNTRSPTDLDETSETAPFIQLFKRDGDFKASVCGSEYVFCQDLLIIEHLALLPPFRGRGVGREILADIIHQLKFRAEVVALKPFPLQFECCDFQDPEMAYDLFTAEMDDSFKAVRKFYKSCGFKRVKDTELMVQIL